MNSIDEKRLKVQFCSGINFTDYGIRIELKEWLKDIDFDNLENYSITIEREFDYDQITDIEVSLMERTFIED